MIEYPDRAKHQIRTKPRFTVAGAPPPAAFIERLDRELGWDFIEIYGLTETSPLLTVSRPDHYTKPDDWARRSHAGVAGIGVQLRPSTTAGSTAATSASGTRRATSISWIARRT